MRKPEEPVEPQGRMLGARHIRAMDRRGSRATVRRFDANGDGAVTIRVPVGLIETLERLSDVAHLSTTDNLMRDALERGAVQLERESTPWTTQSTAVFTHVAIATTGATIRPDGGRGQGMEAAGRRERAGGSEGPASMGPCPVRAADLDRGEWPVTQARVVVAILHSFVTR